MSDDIRPEPHAPAAKLLADALKRHGTDLVFGVPGGGPNLEVIGALADHDIGFVLAHGETSSAIMAAVYGHLTGRLSAAVVTRGPGAAAAVNGAAQATLDRHPLLLITDTVPAATRTRVPHQRIDQRAMFAPVTKHSVVLGDDAVGADLDDLLAEALASPAGAIHIDYDASAASDLTGWRTADSTRADGSTHPGEDELDRAAGLIADARRPVVIIGLGAVAVAGLAHFLDHLDAPALTTYQAIGTIPSEHRRCAGLFTNGASERPLPNEADLLVTVGLDPVEPIPGPWSLDVPVLSLSELPLSDPYYPIDVELVGPLDAVTTALTTRLGGRIDHDWQKDSGQLHRQAVRTELTDTETGSTNARPGGPVEPLDLVTTVAAAAPEGLTVTVDAGAHFLAIMPMWPVTEPNQLLISNGLATMGFALPAAVAASLARPGLPVLCLVGDGGLGMTLAELETVARLQLPVTVVVFNDSALSLIRIKQRGGDGGQGAVAYRPTDFAATAASLGMSGTSVRSAPELAEALTSHSWGEPRLIDVRVDPEQYRHLIAVTRG